MENEVELLKNGIIYVEKVGDQTAGTLTDIFAQVKQLADQMRVENKPVLILTNSEHEGVMDSEARKVSVEIGQQFNFDKSATFGAAQHVRSVRELLIVGTSFKQKIANFETRSEAETWLLEK